MADIKFSCPRCNQHISCDELWGGHQIQCPACQGELTVPTKPAPAVSGGPPPARQAPAHEAPKLVLSQTPAHPPAAAAQAAPRSIPVRNLAPPPPQKSNSAVKVLKISAVVLVLGVGVYFGFAWLLRMQEKASAKLREGEQNADGGQVGHIADLYNVLDATEPGHYRDPRGGGHATGPRQRQGGGPSEIPLAGGQQAMAAAAAADQQLPLLPATWTLDLQAATIPEGRANGLVSGTNFVPETARVDPVGTAQVLRLIQGPATSPSGEVLVYLHLKPGEKLGGQTLTISPDMKGRGVPQVAKRWKNNPKYAPLFRSFSTGYALKLELSQMGEAGMPGKIFLALPDAEHTVVAGLFRVAPRIDESAE